MMKDVLAPDVLVDDDWLDGKLLQLGRRAESLEPLA